MNASQETSGHVEAINSFMASSGDLPEQNGVLAEGGLLIQTRLRDMARESEALFHAATLLVDTTDVDRLLEKILDAIDEHFGHPISTIHLLPDGSPDLVTVAYRGHTVAADQLLNQLSGPGIVARVARTRIAINVADVREDADYIPSIPDTRSELAVPLVINGATIGVLNVESPQIAAFTDADMRLLTTFAELAAVSIRTAQLHERIRTQAGRETLINSIISACHTTTDLDEILKIPCVGLAKSLNVQRAYVAVIDWSDEVARFVHSHAADSSGVFTGEFPLKSLPELSERLWRGEVVAVSDVYAEPILERALPIYDKHHTRSLIYAPVVRSGDWHAILLVCCDNERQWTQDEIDFISTVAEQVGTAFVQAELYEKVVQKQREWELTFDSMSDGVLLVDASGRVYGANAAAAAMLRIARHEIAGVRCCSVLASSDSTACPVHEALSNKTRVLVQSVPTRIGRTIQITVDPMAGGDNAVVVLRDLSELRKVEADARRQSKVLSQLVASSTDPIAMLGTDGCVLWCNVALAETLGRKVDELAGRPLSDLLADDTHQTASDELSRALAGEPRFFETALASGAAGDSWIVATLTPVFDDADVTGLLFVARDVTGSRRAAERAAVADKLRALGQLSSGVAHNFNNALSVILGRTQLLARKYNDPRILEELAIIEHVSHEASNTVRRIQNFARRRLHESHEPIDLRALVADTLEMTSTRWSLEANALAVKYDVEMTATEGPHTVLGNDSELREVFVNVIFNALDAMPDGGRLAIDVGSEGAFVTVRVTDTGSGMDEDAKRRVFEPFFTTKGAKGTGLGLPVSFGIISRHNGRIEFETKPNQGTAFTVFLPARTAGDAMVQMERRVPKLTPLKRTSTILVVDDDRGVRDTIGLALHERGHAVLSASGAEEALAVLRSTRVDLVLTDLSMPDMNGIALIDRVRCDWPGLRVVLMTGADFAGFDGELGEVWADAMLFKPFEIDELCFVVENTIAPDARAVADQ